MLRQYGFASATEAIGAGVTPRALLRVLQDGMTPPGVRIALHTTPRTPQSAQRGLETWLDSHASEPPRAKDACDAHWRTPFAASS